MPERAAHYPLMGHSHPPLPCGYGPRALHRASDRKALYVGSKDGSISEVTLKGSGYDSSFLRRGSSSGVRSLSEWQSGWLWVGRRNGDVELVELAEPKRLHPMVQSRPGRDNQDSVRALGWVDAERHFISFQEGGTWILEHRNLGDRPEATLQSALDGRRLLRLEDEPLCGLLFIVPFQGRDGRFFVTANTLGQVFVWSGDDEGDVRRVDPWPHRQTPGFVNDYSVLWNRQDGGGKRVARGVFLATDRGVHLLYAANKPGARRVACRRLNFPGLGAVCMAITYLEPEDREVCYLWAADSREDGHLFTAKKNENPREISFIPSGHFHAGNQSMLATSWYREEESRLVICQVRRNDEIVLTEYSEVASSQLESDLQKIRQLLSHGDEAGIGAYWAGSEQEAWPPYAQLSELFEQLGEKASTLEALLEFLGDPTAQAAWRILQGLRARPNAEEECRTAVHLWTLSLLGVINRTGGKLKESQRESGYLGIIRWLRQLREDAASSPGCQDLVEALESSGRMVRKWGLFGEANARRNNLIRPLTVLRKQSRNQSNPEQALDLLTYEVLLFERGVALRAEDRSDALPGRSAWDLSGLTVWKRYHVAVSWHWGRVEVYKLEQEHGAEPKLTRRAAFSTEAGPDAEETPRSWGHSRAVLLGKLHAGGRERAYLLTAPALPRDSRRRETLQIRELHPDGTAASLTALKLPAGESLYSLLDLGSGWVLAGLSGHRGESLCLLGQVKEVEGSLGIERWYFCQADSANTAEPADSADRPRNQVWCMARVEPPPPDRDLHDVLVGCQDGSIYYLRIHTSPGSAPRSEWTLVARMSTAVKAVVCRRIRSESRSVLRIVGGGASGSIVAWQELPGGEYVSLWAADEGEQIAGLHLIKIPETEGAPSPMVLGITRDERFVLFNDRDAVADLPFRERPQRIPLPGCRHGTFQRSQRASAFSTCLVPAGLLPDPDGTGQVAAVVTASKHGVLRLLSLHYPHFQSLRKQKFESILTDWWKIVQGNHQLRLVHAAYRAAPSLELILVRWLLDPALPEKLAPRLSTLAPWMLPRNLRQLLRLRTAWKASYRTPQARLKQVLDDTYDSLQAALRETFRLDDLLLYQEICEVALQRGNGELFEWAGKPEASRSQRAADVYLRVFKAIEESLQQWRGGVNREESLARMNVARNMVDGDTAFRLFQATFGKGQGTPFGRVLKRRIGGVRDLVVKGDPTATLEALRAANLSMLRLCKRLSHERKANPRAELAWENGFEPYFSELAAAAARSLRSPFRFNDVVEHGYARTFALAVCACPSAAMQIATRLTETHLISKPDAEDDLSRLVPRQLQILKEIGIELPVHATELFRIAASPSQPKLDPLQDLWLVKRAKGRTAKALDPPAGIWDDFGAGNARALACLWRVYGLVNWFSRLEEILSRDPEALAGAWEDLRTAFDRFCHADVKDLYRHSFAFWCSSVQLFACTLLGKAGKPRIDEGACEALLKELAGKLKQDERTDPLQPRTVLLSRSIAAWAVETSAELTRRYTKLEIFQPEYSIFREVLARLERAARGFPDSAAVRMNVVQGVLGHHLLEDLDEHLLELQEIAHVLDPLLVRRYRERRQSLIRDGMKNEPVAQRFAFYLMTRSARAESLPENLRTLFSLLTPGSSENESQRTLGNLLEHFKERDRWRVKFGEVGREYTIESEVFHHLDLVLKELALNADKHPHSTSTGKRPSVKVRFVNGKRLQIRITFKFQTTASERKELDHPTGSPRENLGRLYTLMKQGLQGPIEPRPDRAVASSGMGLYVANFAAAIVDWELAIARVRHDGSLGECVFTLTQLEEPEEGDEPSA